MEIAVLSDIHGNYEAFRTCVQYLLERKITDFYFLGDYAGDCAFPQKTMNLLYELKEKYNCTFVRGNKEDYWLDYRDSGEKGWKEFDSTTGSLYYSYHNLTERDLCFFKSLKIKQETVVFNKTKICICHGSPFGNKEKLLPDRERTYEIMESTDADLIICGHTHIQGVFQHRGKKVINPGAVGVPLFSEGKAQFLILHETEDGCREEFVSLNYDVEKEIENLHLSGLDEFAPYWCKVTEQLLRTGKNPHGKVLVRAMQYCTEEEGSCNWPDIPEKYWEKAFADI